MSSKKTILAKKKAPPVATATPCSAGWLPPETVPKNETCILAHFGWPWPVVAIWCLVQGEWAIAQLAPCSEDDGRGWETEWEKGSSLIGWMPLPPLPNDLTEPTPPGVGSSSLFADWGFAKSAELVAALKERDDSWDELGHLALLIITALEEQTADRELEGIEDRAREAYRSVLRRGA